MPRFLPTVQRKGFSRGTLWLLRAACALCLALEALVIVAAFLVASFSVFGLFFVAAPEIRLLAETTRCTMS
ncbi:MAG: hypothetical protein IJ678_00270 [Kiritimatiellae bacterium]|nr:hypothetical protein [Kiritimatiellia bacterium]